MSTDNDAELREWMGEFGPSNSWYWSDTQGKYLMLADGQTDTWDVAQALARDQATPTEEAAAADFWALAAESAASSAGVKLAMAETAYYEDPSSHNLAVMEEAAEAHRAALATWEEIHDLREEVHHETGVDDFEGGIGDYNPWIAAEIYLYLFSDEHASGLTAAELAEYRHGVALDAEQLAEAGYDVARLASDDAAIQAAAEASEGLTAEGAIATEDEMLALAELERQAAEQTAAMASEAEPVTAEETTRFAAEELVAKADRLLDELGAAGKAHEEYVARYEATRALYNELYDEEYYRTRCEGDGAKEDAYCDATWEDAEQWVAAGVTAEEYRLAAEWAAELDDAAWATEIAFTAAVNEQLAEHDRPAAEPGATDEALGRLLSDLDQARCARDADDTPEEDRHTWTEHVEHLEEQVAQAQEEAAKEASSDPQTVSDGDAEAWGVSDGTPTSELPQTYAEWKAEGMKEQPGEAGEDGYGPHEWSHADPDDTGPAPVEFRSSEELRELADGDDDEAAEARQELAERDAAGKDEEPTAAERAVAETHAAVEASVAAQPASDHAVTHEQVSAVADVDE